MAFSQQTKLLMVSGTRCSQWQWLTAQLRSQCKRDHTRERVVQVVGWALRSLCCSLLRPKSSFVNDSRLGAGSTAVAIGNGVFEEMCYDRSILISRYSNNAQLSHETKKVRALACHGQTYRYPGSKQRCHRELALLAWMRHKCRPHTKTCMGAKGVRPRPTWCDRPSTRYILRGTTTPRRCWLLFARRWVTYPSKPTYFVA